MQVKASIVAILATCSLLVIAKPLYKGIHASQSVRTPKRTLYLLNGMVGGADDTLEQRSKQTTSDLFCHGFSSVLFIDLVSRNLMCCFVQVLHSFN